MYSCNKLDATLGVRNIIPQPHDSRRRTSVDLHHHVDLLTLLLDIALANAERVYPEKQDGEGRVDEQMLESAIQIAADWDCLPTAINEMGEVLHNHFLNGEGPGV